MTLEKHHVVSYFGLVFYFFMYFFFNNDSVETHMQILQTWPETSESQQE